MQARIQQHLSENNQQHHLKGLNETLAAAANAAVAASCANCGEDPVAGMPLDETPKQSEPASPFRKLVYLAYSYIGIPHYVEVLKEDLQKRNSYLIFNPLGNVEEQFDEEHKESLFSLKSGVPESICRFLKLPEDLHKSIYDPKVIQTLRRGDSRSDIEAMIFKELYFLVRSSVVICDLVMEPYGCELFQKLFYAKMFDIPVIGISPLGKPVSGYIQKYLKVLLTDDFNTENILPLVRAYTP